MIYLQKQKAATSGKVAALQKHLQPDFNTFGKCVANFQLIDLFNQSKDKGLSVGVVGRGKLHRYKKIVNTSDSLKRKERADRLYVCVENPSYLGMMRVLRRGYPSYGVGDVRKARAVLFAGRTTPPISVSGWQLKHRYYFLKSLKRKEYTMSKFQATSTFQETSTDNQSSKQTPQYFDNLYNEGDDFSEVSSLYRHELRHIMDAAAGINTLSKLQTVFNVERMAFQDGQDATQITDCGYENLSRAINAISHSIQREVCRLGDNITRIGEGK